jgi:hypothetical protein
MLSVDLGPPGLSVDRLLLALARSAGSRAMPATRSYDAQGRLRDTHLGAPSEATLAAGLARLRAPR